MDKVLFVFPSIVIIFVILVVIGSQTQLNAAVAVSNTTLSEERFVGSKKLKCQIQRLLPVTPHDKIPHQIVFALPLRNDSKIWTGTVTFTARSL